MHEGWIVVGYDNSAGEGAADEEDHEAVVYGFEGGFDVFTWELGLGGYHGDVFGADAGEGGGPEGAEEAFELAEGALGVVLCEGAWVFEVAEAVCVALGVAADHGYEGEEEEDAY